MARDIKNTAYNVRLDLLPKTNFILDEYTE